MAALIHSDEPVTTHRDPVVHPQRVAGTDDPQSRTHARGPGRCRFGGRFPLLCSQRYQRRRIASNEEALLRRIPRSWHDRSGITTGAATVKPASRPATSANSASAGAANYDFARHARRRQFHDRRRDSASVRIMQADPGLGILQGLIVGLPSPAPSRASFSSGCASACAPIPSARQVAGPLRPLLGPQRGTPAGAVHRALRAAGAPEDCTRRPPCLQPRSARSGADAPRRLRGARAAAGGCGLGGKSADAAGIHPPGSALVPGQHAVFPLSPMPGFRPVSRYQLALAILMFLGAPGLDRAAGARYARSSPSPMRRASFIRLRRRHGASSSVLVMWFSPKIASAIDILLHPQLRRGFGGAGLVFFILNYVIETVYAILLCPILWFGHTIFLAGLLFGREIGWIGQTRDDHAVPFTLACIICGRTRCWDAPRSASWRSCSQRRSPMRRFLPVVRLWLLVRCRWPSTTPHPRRGSKRMSSLATKS